MNKSITSKLLVIGLIAGASYLASLLVLTLIHGREEIYTQALSEIGTTWGSPQTIAGPVFIYRSSTQETARYALPSSLSYETVLTPETRSRGIFSTTVYTAKTVVRGEFNAADIATASQGPGVGSLSVAITDTKGLSSPEGVMWGGQSYEFESGSGTIALQSQGIHAPVPAKVAGARIPFSYEITVRGSSSLSFVPLGEETLVSVSSPWKSPKFTGQFLPTERTVSDEGFDAQWNVSAYGRPYAQTGELASLSWIDLSASVAGVTLHEPVDLYTLLYRSVAYAILFFAATFLTFFAFDIRARLNIHPVQYALIGAALALFYLLLLALSEHVGFMSAYALATLMITALITTYSAFVLKQKARALIIAGMMLALYGYLYFVLQLENLALLFGSLLLFVLLACAMYFTRNMENL